MSVKLLENDFLFLQVDTKNYFGGSIWIGIIVPNTVYNQFQKKNYG